MATVNAPLVSFNGGELGKVMAARIDQKGYLISCETQRNFLPYAQGPMTRRPGLRYIDSFVDHNKFGVFLPFEYSSDISYLILAIENEFRFYTDDRALEVEAVASTIANGTFDTDLTGWTAASTGTSSVTHSGGRAVFNCTGNGVAAIRQSIAVAAGDQGKTHVLIFEVANGPMDLKIGTTAGGVEVTRVTNLGRGRHQIGFVPGATPVYVTFEANKRGEKWLDNVSFMAGGAFVLPTPYLEGELPDIHYDQKGDILYLTHGNHAPRKLERRGPSAWSLTYFEPKDGPFLPLEDKTITLTPSGTNGIINLTASEPMFDADDIRTLFRLTSPGQYIEQIFTAANQQSDTILVTGIGATQRSFNYQISGNLSGKVTIEASIGNEDNFTTYQVRTYSGTSNETINLEDSPKNDNLQVYYRVVIRAADYTSGSATVRLTYSGGTGSGTCRILSITSPTVAIAEVTTKMTSIGGTQVWQQSEWSEERGFPNAVTFFGPRLWFGRGIKLWASASDDYENFSPGTEDDDSISRTIAGATDAIKWLAGALNLGVGSSSQELVGRASSFDDPITPSTFQTQSPSQEGSASIQPVVTAGAMLYVQRSRRRLFEFAPTQTGYGSGVAYASVDLSRLNPEMFDDRIRTIALQREPERRIYAVLDSGYVRVATYKRDEQITGWSTFITSGKVEDVCVLALHGEDAVYMVVRRDINGELKRFIERVDYELQVNDEDLMYLDAALSLPLERPGHMLFMSGTVGLVDFWCAADVFDAGDLNKIIWANGGRARINEIMSPKMARASVIFQLESVEPIVPGRWGKGTEVLSVGGLTHLLNMEVQVVADGAILPSKTVSPAGNVALDFPASCIHIGLPFQSRYKSLKLALGAQQGTALTQSKMVGPVGVIYLRTGNGTKIGSSFETMVPLSLRSDASEYGSPPKLREGELIVLFPGGYETDPRICIEIDDASPCTISALVPTVSEHDRP